jgi:hypothetical protein
MATSLFAQTALLEDFSSLRKNANGDDLWSFYQGCAQQTGGIQNGQWVGTLVNCEYPIYVHFLPIPYVYPQGFMQSWLKTGSPNPNADRLSFKFKCDQPGGGLVMSQRTDGGTTFDVGTYVKSHLSTVANEQGQHYYHSGTIDVHSGRWIQFTINKHPNHIVGGAGAVDVGDDPEFVSPTFGGPVHYFDGMTRFYFGMFGWTPNAGTTCSLDDFYVSQSPYKEADDVVYSVVASHTGPISGYADGRYEVRWSAPPAVDRTFNIRYSTQPMHVNGFASGTDGGAVATTGNTYQSVYWNSPNMPEKTAFYVAIQPSGSTNFTEVYIPAMNGGSTAPQVSCDVNGDGKVDSLDVTAATNAALGKAPCVSDLDQNGRCDVVDVQRVINASLGGTCRVGQ